MNAGPAGFNDAPVVKALFLTTTGTSVFWQVIHQGLVEPVSPVFKPFLRAFVFKNTGELVFGVALLYYFRILERQSGSGKFGAYTVVVSSLAYGIQTALQAAYKLKPLPSGPYGFLFASFIPFIFDIPPSQRFSLFGIQLSDKAFLYLMGLQLVLSNGTGSMMAALCGILAGFTYRGNLCNLQKFKFPSFVNQFFANTLGRLLSGGHRPAVTMHANRGSRHRQSANQGTNNQQTNVVVSESAVQQLLLMGFEENQVRTALQMTNNDIQSAIAMLVDRG